MPLFAAKGMMSSGGGGNFYTLAEAKRDTADNSSYRQPTGMFDVATSSSGEVYTLNGERNTLTGLYNAVVAKIGAIGAVSWQYTFSAAKNVYPCALACNTEDNSIFVCLMVTTNENGQNNYNLKRYNYANTGWNDSTSDAIYHIMRISSSGSRTWENVWSSSNSLSYPSSINRMNNAGNGFEHANVFENRNTSPTQHETSLIGAPDLKITKTRSYDGTNMAATTPFEPRSAAVNDSANAIDPTTDTLTVLGKAYGGEESYEAYALDGPAFGGRPQSTSNIVIDYDNDQFYILVAGNATTTDMSASRSTMQALQIPFSGVTVEARELVYPGGWDQNAKITLDRTGNLLVPWTGTNKEAPYKNATNRPELYDTGVSASNINTANTGAFLKLDWDNVELDLIYFNLSNNAPTKVCKVESEPPAEGTLYEYITTGGLTPATTVQLGKEIASRDNTVGDNRRQLGRHSNFVQLHKRNTATSALEWVRTFFAIPRASTRDMNNWFNDGSTTNKGGGAFTADIHVSDSKVFSNGIYYVGNVILPSYGVSGTTETTVNNYFGFIAKVNFDGKIDYIREIRALEILPDTPNPNEKPVYHYAPTVDGGVLLDSINFDAFNNMIVTGRHVDAQFQGTVGTYVNNMIFKLPHNGDLIGPIEVISDYDSHTKRFTYSPASSVRCWEETKYDTSISYGGNLETYKLLRCCALWNTSASPTNPSTLGAVSTQTNYNAWMSSGQRMVDIGAGGYVGRFLWTSPQTNLQIDPTTNRQWDRATRRSSSSVFLQTYEESTANSRIEVQKSVPGFVYVDQTVNTDNAQTDFDVPSYAKAIGQGNTADIQEIAKHELPNAMVSVSQYWDGDLGLRQQLLTRHSPTGGVEARIYDTGYNTYPKDVCVDEVGNIYTVGWTADTTNSNNFGCGYVTCYDKDMVFQWDYQYVNSDTNTLGSATDNYQIHACAVTLDSANTAKLFVAGHFTQTNSGTDTQLATIGVIPLSIAGSGASTVVGMGITNSSIALGGGQSGNAVDGIFGLDVTQVDATDGNFLYVGYAGNTYDTTGTTNRGMYGVTKWNGSTPDTTTANNWAYITGDDLRLTSFAFGKGVDSYEKEFNSPNGDFGLRFAVGGDETQAGDTNGVVIIANVRRDSAGSKTHSGAPLSTTSVVINNANGADVVRDLRWGYAETPGVNTFKYDAGSTTRVDNRLGESAIENDAINTFYGRNAYEDRLYVALSVTNQFSQIDTYVMEITAAQLPSRTGGNYRTPDAANVTRVGKLSTSGITQPAGVCVLGPQYGTLMVSATSANSGTPNDRQLLTAKVPLDMSKKDSAYIEVGSQFVYWDDPEFSLTLIGKGLFSVELDQLNTTSYNDGTRFYWGGTTANGSWAQYSGNSYPDVDNVGTYVVRTQDLQQYKQS